MEELNPQNQMNAAVNPSYIIEDRSVGPNGEAITNRYQIVPRLKGNFGPIIKLRNIDTQRVYTVKKIFKTSLAKSFVRQRLITEIEIHKQIKHHHIVQFQHVFEDSECVYILFEELPDDNLMCLIKKRKGVTQLEAKYYLRQIISALLYLRQKKVIHRDLKSNNIILCKDMTIKIAEFGMATKLKHNQQTKKSICGTSKYIAPQVLEGKGYSYEVDIWYLGVILCTLVTGKHPFQTEDIKQTYKNIKTCKYQFPKEKQFSGNVIDLIQKMLAFDPSKRPTLQEIVNHPFMSGLIPNEMPSDTFKQPPSQDFLDKYSDHQQEEL